MNEGGIIGKQNISTPTTASGMWSAQDVFLRNTVTSEWPSFNAPDTVTYNVLGGGGGGASGNYDYTPGGAGSLVTQGSYTPTGGQVYTVTVGAGGSPATSGGTSSIIGGTLNASQVGGDGVSENTNSGTGASNATYAGSQGTSFAGGGGAGAGGNGKASSAFNGADGGDGVTFLHPTGLTVGGGGGGSGHSNYGENTYGGGHGGIGNGTGESGEANRGGGGGGGRASGGSGRVMIRYADTYLPAAATTGNPTITVANGYRYYDFTSSGSITF